MDYHFLLYVLFLYLFNLLLINTFNFCTILGIFRLSVYIYTLLLKLFLSFYPKKILIQVLILLFITFKR